MLNFQQTLYKVTKLNLCNYLGPTTEEINSYFSSQNMEPLNEEVLFKNMTDDEKILKFKDFFNKINTSNDELLIIDPYLFPKKPDSTYKDFITKILKASNYKTLKIFTNKANFNINLFNAIKSNLPNNNITLCYSEDFHDRVWISNNSQGFIIRSSLNGIGKKYVLSTYSIIMIYLR